MIEAIVPGSTSVDVTQEVVGVIEVSVPAEAVVVEVSSAAGPRGLSAYQVALLNGFVGSQSAWLASLIGGTGDIAAHINDLTPHPVYDDMPSLLQSYQNGLI